MPIARESIRSGDSDIQWWAQIGPLISVLEAALWAGDTETVNIASIQIKVRFADAVTLPSGEFQLYSLARLVGQAAMLEGDRETARASFERALDWATSVGHRPEIALSRFAIAELLLGGDLEERTTAQDHLDFAIEEFRAMKMQPSLERALRHKGLLHA